MPSGLSLGGDGIPWSSERTGADCTVHLGEGGENALEVVLTDSEARPTEAFLRDTYTDRREGRLFPVLVVAQYGEGRAALCGPSGEEPTVFRDVSASQAKRVCEVALEKPSGASARAFLGETLSRLSEGGSLHRIVDDSKEYATGLGERLRERIYDDVVPQLAEALADARDLRDPTKEELDETYRMTLVLLYRLLFVAYAEDEGFFPRYRNATYDKYSIGEKARQIHEGMEFGNRPTLWNEVATLTRAIHGGDASLGLPAYGGRLLSDDEDWTEAGYQLSQVELPDSTFGLALEALLVDDPPDGSEGPVDFHDVGVHEFGVIYEGLLESELSVARGDLTTETNGGEEQYVVAEDGEDVVVAEGDVYLHGRSGERKGTGTYYTKPRFVEHLLDYSLDPALEDHLERVDRIREGEGDTAAADAFFDFRTADIAMGSGHFLVGAVDRIEKAFRDYLRENTLSGVEAELDALEDAAEAAFEGQAYTPDVERSQLLRRQVARRCLYGVDLNELTTELARLSLWAHTFVPGLPLTSLDYNLQTGDSLAGIGTLDEVGDLLDVERSSRTAFPDGSSVLDEIRDDLAELGGFADRSAERAGDARETRRELDDRLEPVRARFDILAASRIDDDLDPVAASSAEPDELEDSSVRRKAKRALASTDPVHFPAAFPEVFAERGGFDVVVGNPPWEEAVLEADEFWTRYVPGLQGRPQGDQERLKRALRADRPDLVEVYEDERAEQERRRRILANGPYPGMGTGDPDTYKAFSWRFWHLSRDGGSLGVVLPRSSLVAAGSETFRRTLLTDGTVTDITLLKNEGGWVFDAVTEQYTVALLAAQRTPPTADAELPLRGPFPSRESYERGLEAGPYRFDLDRALSWTTTASLPMLPADPRSVAAFRQQSEHPPLGLDEPGAWRARPNTELHATNDKTDDDGNHVMEFLDDPPDDYWPVFRGGSFTHWVPDTGVRYAWIDPDVAREYLQEQRENSARYAGTRSAFYEMSDQWVHDPETLPCLSPRIAFRDIARSSDPRTIVPALVPPETVLTNKAPYFLWPRGDERDEAYLLGVTSSIPFDWYARRFVELGVNYHILNAIPVPRPEGKSALRRRVVELAGRLAAVDGRYRSWAAAVGVDFGPLDEETRRPYVHELDAVVAHLYGFTRDHLDVVFRTFHDGDEMMERLDAVLDHYEDWVDAD